MLLCPRCQKRLLKTKSDKGFFYVCPQCQGRAVAVSVLRRWLAPQQVNRIWAYADRDDSAPGLACPICQKPTAAVPVNMKRQRFSLDVCMRCQFIWFDAQEFDRIYKAKPPAQPNKPLSPEAREQIALAQLELLEERERGGEFDAQAPDEQWKWIPGLFGMPVENETGGLRCWPLQTWCVAAGMVVTFLLTFQNLPNVVQKFGFVPAEAWRMGGLTLVTSFFLHADIFHLIGNTYFLLIFGDNVEEYLGRLRFLGLLAIADFFGAMLHMLADPHSNIPCIGASGGISGVIVFYALQFPHARLGFLVRVWYVFRWIQMPAYFALICWIALQLVYAALQLGGLTNISALAHLGGAAVGVGAWLLWRKRPYG